MSKEVCDEFKAPGFHTYLQTLKNIYIKLEKELDSKTFGGIFLNETPII